MRTPYATLFALGAFAASGLAWAGPNTPPGHPDISGLDPEDCGDVERLAGEIVETMDSGGYTYALIREGTVETWVAGPMTELSVGDRVSMPLGSLMANFYSRTMNRTFDRIYFVHSINIEGVEGVAAHGAAPSEVTDGALESLAGGQTVYEVYRDSASLSGQPVAIRGQVVKFTPEILGTNWLHIQDGSGAESDGTHDLVVTTSQEVAVGEVVVVSGVLSTDRDFGMGYQYDVIIEDAELAWD